MNNKDDETKRIPIVNKQDDVPPSPIHGFDPSKVMFIPSDKNSAPTPASPVPEQPAFSKPDKQPVDKSSTAVSAHEDTDIDKTVIIPAIDNTTAEKTTTVPFIENSSQSTSPVQTTSSVPVSDPDATAEIPVITPKQEPETPAIAPTSQNTVLNQQPAVNKAPETGKKTHRWMFAIGFSIISIILCISIIMTYVFPRIIEDGGVAILDNVTAIIGEPPKHTNVLLVGTDNGGYHTDTMMVASYDNESQSVHVMQIPRDTYVKGNGRADKKINSAYFIGIDTLKDEIFKAYGIEIHRYLAVELDGFIEIIDAIGGVEVDVPINMHYDDPVQDLHIHIDKGLQVLSGKDAEGFVRYRKGNDGSSYPLGDIDRMKAQKQFVQNTVSKIISIDGLSKLPELIGIVNDNIETDISTTEATSYATKILSLGSDKITFHTAPGVPLYKYGGWYYFVDGQENQTLVMEHFNGKYNKKSYTPVYFDLSPDASETASATDSDYNSSDVSDDERYTYYSPENDAGYYDDEDGNTSSGVPVIDDDTSETDSSDSSDSSSQQGNSSQNNKPSSSQGNKPSDTKPDSSASGSSNTAPETDDAPSVQTPQKPAENLPPDAPQFDFD